MVVVRIRARSPNCENSKTEITLQWNCISQFCYNNAVFPKTVGAHHTLGARLKRSSPIGHNVKPATGVPDHRAANSEKEATLTKQANDFRGRIFSQEDIFARGYVREKIFSREDIFAGRYFRVNSKFAKISSRENISNSLFAKFSSRENKVLYSIGWFVCIMFA